MPEATSGLTIGRQSLVNHRSALLAPETYLSLPLFAVSTNSFAFQFFVASLLQSALALHSFFVSFGVFQGCLPKFKLAALFQGRWAYLGPGPHMPLPAEALQCRSTIGEGRARRCTVPRGLRQLECRESESNRRKGPVGLLRSTTYLTIVPTLGASYTARPTL